MNFCSNCGSATIQRIPEAIIGHEMSVTSAVRSTIKIQKSLLDVLSFRATKCFFVDEPLSHVMDSGRCLQALWKTVKPLLRPHSGKREEEAPCDA